MNQNHLVDYLDLINAKRIAILGDVMLDRYVWGNASRISQEAPVPVVQVQRQSSVPGGAANVGRNVISLGGKAEIFGVVGKDHDGEELKGRLRDVGAGIGHLIEIEGRPTTVKTRVLAGNQQVVRIDQEATTPISAQSRMRLRKHVELCLEQGGIDALILEDYAKGVLGKDFIQAVVNHARSRGIMTTLDPHPHNMFNVKGLTLMTPNRSEAFALAGVKFVPGTGEPLSDKPLMKVASILRRKWHPEYLLVTLGAEGMALFSEGDAMPVHIPTKARQVFDVSGAGDTVMATMVLALCAGASPLDAARIANYAAGVVVGLVGTAAIEANVLRKAIINNN